MMKAYSCFYMLPSSLTIPKIQDYMHNFRFLYFESKTCTSSLSSPFYPQYFMRYFISENKWCISIFLFVTFIYPYYFSLCQTHKEETCRMTSSLFLLVNFFHVCPQMSKNKTTSNRIIIHQAAEIQNAVSARKLDSRKTRKIKV